MAGDAGRTDGTNFLIELEALGDAVLGKMGLTEDDGCPDCGHPVLPAIDRNEFIRALGEALRDCGLVLAKVNMR